MTDYFFDSSALVKRYITEQGSQWIQSISQYSAGNRIFLSQITQVEVMSAVGRLKRAAAISARTSRAIRLHLERHTKREYDVFLLSTNVNQRAQDLLDLHPLRAADAIQLASALEIHTRFMAAKMPPITFISGDIRLLTAAVGEGLMVDNPNNHP